MIQVANRLLVTATPAIPAPAASGFRRMWNSLSQWWLHTPLTSLAIYCVVSVLLQENYPFSHFPMYSNPSPERPYYILADEQGQPLPIASLTGVTCPKIGKIYRTETEQLAKKRNVGKDKLSSEDKQGIGEKMFTYFRKEAATHQQTLPPKLQLIRMELSYRDGKLLDTPQVIARE